MGMYQQQQQKFIKQKRASKKKTDTAQKRFYHFTLSVYTHWIVLFSAWSDMYYLSFFSLFWCVRSVVCGVCTNDVWIFIPTIFCRAAFFSHFDNVLDAGLCLLPFIYVINFKKKSHYIFCWDTHTIRIRLGDTINRWREKKSLWMKTHVRRIKKANFNYIMANVDDNFVCVFRMLCLLCTRHVRTPSIYANLYSHSFDADVSLYRRFILYSPQ